jgi:hypothetical protein
LATQSNHFATSSQTTPEISAQTSRNFGLDEIPPSRNVHYIRQMMVQTGVLVERHEDLERLPAWLDHHLLAIPTDHANLVRPYLHWFLLRRARRRAVNRSFPASAGRELRRRILVALELLDWLDGNRITLDQLQQDDLDRWLSEQNTQRRHLVRYFLKWTHPARSFTKTGRAHHSSSATSQAAR